MTRVLEKYWRPGVKGTPFCPGCGHGILMGLILRAIDELGLDMDKMLFVSGIGCAAWIPSPHFAGDTLHTLHGRALAFATGAKLANPELCVMVISGDGDLSAIGGNHLIHAARRNIDLKVICANNMIYGMTGGQVAATTPHRAKTATTGQGNPYPPFDLCRLVIAAGGTYVARYGVTQPRAMIRSIKHALGHQGFSFIEALSPCPTQFGRRNQLERPEEMIQDLFGRCISLEGAETLSPEERSGKIITGEFLK
ncbi:MAG TPA: thiamine pyrophosphate-dependent enzyme [Thermodesulfobacteriota bacterium]|nr:thiamine pyrophosphate-dependent enzyme [Thermodesulfobacteriota bacterium]